MTALTIKTLCLVTEVNPHRQTSSVWTGAGTVGEIIALVQNETAFSTTQPSEFLKKNNLVSFNDFLNAQNTGRDDVDFSAWYESLPLDAHFEAAIDCAADDGHTIRVYFTRNEALHDGAPRYMSEERFEGAVNLVFGE